MKFSFRQLEVFLAAAHFQNITRAGDNFVASTDLYGGTWNLFANTMKDMGIECRFVDPTDPEAFAKATDDRTRCYYAETLLPSLLEWINTDSVEENGIEILQLMKEWDYNMEGEEIAPSFFRHWSGNFYRAVFLN